MTRLAPERKMALVREVMDRWEQIDPRDQGHMAVAAIEAVADHLSAAHASAISSMAEVRAYCEMTRSLRGDVASIRPQAILDRLPPAP